MSAILAYFRNFTVLLHGDSLSLPFARESSSAFLAAEACILKSEDTGLFALHNVSTR